MSPRELVLELVAGALGLVRTSRALAGAPRPAANSCQAVGQASPASNEERMLTEDHRHGHGTKAQLIFIRPRASWFHRKRAKELQLLEFQFSNATEAQIIKGASVVLELLTSGPNMTRSTLPFPKEKCILFRS